METYTAYCSVCDARVEVGFRAGGGEGGAPVHVRCLDHYAGCGGETCPLPSETVTDPGPELMAVLAGHLEFAPLRGAPRWPATLADSAAVLRRGRRASLERQLRTRLGPID